MTSRQRQRQLKRRRAQQAARPGFKQGQTLSGPPPGHREKLSAHGAGEPRGRFFRPLRRIANYVARGEHLERQMARAETPSEREAAQRGLAEQIVKVERTARRLSR